jgi:DNA-binding CsgD family transcriptional regulator
VRNLYGPMTLWTLPRAMDSDLSLDLPDDAGLAGAWSPGWYDPLVGRRTFACSRCWKIQGMTMTDERGWNLFVTHMSGGLLYGHEVERPRLEAPMKRKKRFAPRPNRRGIGLRARIVDLLMLGFDRARIALSLHIKVSCVDSHVKVIHREHGVHNRVELAMKLGRTLVIQPKALPARIVERRKKVRRLRARRMSLRQIAARLNINLKTAHADVKALRNAGHLAPAFAGETVGPSEGVG